MKRAHRERSEESVWKTRIHTIRKMWQLLGSVRFALMIVLLLAAASILAVAVGELVVPPG